MLRPPPALCRDRLHRRSVTRVDRYAVQSQSWAMSRLREMLEQRLAERPSLRVDTWKDTELVCLFHHGREFAHFHGQDVLDIRLSPKIIREEGLSRDVSARVHPDRSPNSRWICFEMTSVADVDRLLHLVDRACCETL